MAETTRDAHPGPSPEGPSGSSGHVPMRTCVGCRRRGAAAALVRLGLEGGRLVVRGRRGAGKGRGAWLHPQRACVEGALKTRAFGRAFKAEVGDAAIGDPARLIETVLAVGPSK